jgi:hypothetical protein
VRSQNERAADREKPVDLRRASWLFAPLDGWPAEMHRLGTGREAPHILIGWMLRSRQTTII